MALILIADSSAQERQRLRKIIETQDHVVVEADSSAYCKEIAEYHHPQCVLLNHLLANTPELDLLQTLHTLEIATIIIADQTEVDNLPALTIRDQPILALHPEKAVLLQSLVMVLDRESETSTPQSQSIHSPPNGLDSSPPSLSPPAQIVPNQKSQDKVTALQQLLSIDKLQHLVTLGSDKVSESLTDLTGCSIQFQPSAIETMTAQSLQQLLQGHFGYEPICSTQLPFTGGLNGTAQLFFPQVSALSLTAMLTEENPGSPDFDTLKQEALTEVGNIVLNSVMGAMSNALAQSLTFSVPVYQEAPVADLTQSLASDFSAVILLAQTHFKIKELKVSGDIILFFKMQLFFDLANNTLA